MFTTPLRTLNIPGTICLSFLILAACTTVKESKNRPQLVAGLSCRTLSVSDTLQMEIEHEVYCIVSKRSSQDLQLFYREMNASTWKVRAGDWEEVQELRQAAFDEWKSGNIESTLIIFPTTMTSPMKSKVMTVTSVEYEHASLTGTCILLVEEGQDQPVYFDYIERK